MTYSINRNGAPQTYGSFAHCINYLLLICQMAGHSGNLFNLQSQGWTIQNTGE